VYGVRLDEPRWWYAAGGEGTLAARALAPLGGLYGSIVVRRYLRQVPYRSGLPVVCIGNFTAGGTGKTPLSLLVVERLRATGETPACLTRGYGGRQAGPLWVDADSSAAHEVGDEALLLARGAPTLVSRDRRAGAQAIESGPATAIVMDDGLQNPELEKDFTIAVVDAERGLGNGAVFPAGPLRAPLDFQLGLVDSIVVSGRSPDTNAHGGSIFERLKRAFPGPVLTAAQAPAGDTRWLEGARVLAFAGIANPDRFFRMLAGLGASVEAEERFADHHAFSERDAGRLLGRAEAQKLMLVTTEKDLARLAGAHGRCGELRMRSRALPIRLTFEERDLTRLDALLVAAVRRRRSGT
jgi:tetraacyldisaccharide 4'-kinase